MDINELFKNLSSIQEKAQEQQKELEDKIFTGSVAGGEIYVKLRGNYECEEVHISKSMFEDGDESLISDLVKEAFSIALSKIQDEVEKISSSMTGGMGF